MKYTYTLIILAMFISISKAQTWEVDQGLMMMNYAEEGGFPPTGPVSKNWSIGIGNGFADPDFFTIGKDDFIVDYIVNSNALVINDETLAVGISEENPVGKLHVNHSDAGLYPVPATMIGPYTGSGGYLLVNKPNSDASSAIARFRDNGNSTVVINEEEATFQLQVFGDIMADNLFGLSDARYKKDVQSLTNATALISQLRPKSYFFDQTSNSRRNLPSSKQFGFMAQDLEDIVSHLVQARPVKNEEGEIIGEEKAINYLGLIPVLVASQQELLTQIKQLQQENAELRNHLSGLEK